VLDDSNWNSKKPKGYGYRRVSEIKIYDKDKNNYEGDMVGVEYYQSATITMPQFQNNECNKESLQILCSTLYGGSIAQNSIGYGKNIYLLEKACTIHLKNKNGKSEQFKIESEYCVKFLQIGK